MKLRCLTILIAALIIWGEPNDGLSEERIAGLHFDILYDGLNKGYAEEVLENSETSFVAIAEILGHNPGKKITIILTTSPEQFRQLTHGVIPEWSAAVAIDNQCIVISPLTGRRHNLPRIMAHEIIHIVINDAAGEEFVPRWFHEGCAQNLSGEWRIRDRLYMVWHAARGNLLSFEDIQNVFSSHRSDAGLAYDQSMLAIHHFMKKNGRKALPAVLEGMKDGHNFASAFQQASGLWPSEFEKDYLENVRQNYGSRSLYSVIPGTWTLIMMIAFIVYFIKKRRNKQLMQQWEIVEAAENIINFEDYIGPQ